ncbi:serine/threonine-protein phosphatase 1 regulatory subunit 10-like isoform X2 [Argiope bruennichi]|nr:serine/threonine-protein phosphatase 1 regulatory subunit 10-like isoform X2 [Argiope bruennichi]
MTRFLKLVRHEDGKWKALPTETDDIAQVSLKERQYAPIDPDQLLKALDSLLSKSGGIKSVEDVPRLASLMKKFSKKLVSRCVYCNVLMATEADILSEYLDKGGWDTINTWLDYAKSSSSASFLIEMLKLCKLLPMTVNRLKENNTAKLIKSLTKHENDDVKSLSSELVSSWMTIIKGKKPDPPPSGDKKKKKSKQKSEVKKEPEPEVENADAKSTSEVPKSPVKIKGIKRPSSEKEIKKEEYYEDVKIDPEPLMSVPKKPRTDRPKTAKVYHKKFRSTGLEEEVPLPKKIPKKAPTVDKTVAITAAKNVLKLNTNLPDRINEKKLKPENLAVINETSSASKGIKLIPAKPRPTYMLHESASFMDALTSLPATAPTKRKKKQPPNKPSNSPTSPTITAPKLQFYKDTLEMNDENKEKQEREKDNNDDVKKEGSPEKENEAKSENKSEEEPMEVCTEEGGHTPPNMETENTPSPLANGNSQDMEDEKVSSDPNHFRSILSHGRRRGKKKSVKWVEDENIKEIFYFELDETERVNVLKTQNFGDLKSIELRREREAIELAKRQAGDRMEEMTRWWIVPILIDLPPPLVEPGCQSKEKEVERLRQQTTLQEIYFTKEMIPDSPHEPDLEIVPAQEPKIIPLDEDNVIGPLVDYSNYEPPKSAPLPEVLSSLIKLSPQLPVSASSPVHNQEQVYMEKAPIKQPLLSSEGLIPHNGALPLVTPYDPGESVPPNIPSNSLLGPPPAVQNVFGMSSPPMTDNHNIAPQSEWRTLDMVQNQYYDKFPPNSGGSRNITPPNQGPGMNMRPRMMNDNYRPMHKGPPRGMGPRPRNIHRVPCRHFMAGSCRFGMKCSFLHPGVNGPPL